MLAGLGQMHHEAAIVHRDIAPWNIVIQRGAPEGSRGILIDFSCAAVTNSGPVPLRPDETPVSKYRNAPHVDIDAEP